MAPPASAEGIGAECWLVDAGLPGPVAHIAIGRFRGPRCADAALVSARHVQLLADAAAAAPAAAPSGRRRLARACVLTLQAPVRDARTLPCPRLDQVGPAAPRESRPRPRPSSMQLAPRRAAPAALPWPPCLNLCVRPPQLRSPPAPGAEATPAQAPRRPLLNVAAC